MCLVDGRRRAEGSRDLACCGHMIVDVPSLRSRGGACRVVAECLTVFIEGDVPTIVVTYIMYEVCLGLISRCRGGLDCSVCLCSICRGFFVVVAIPIRSPMTGERGWVGGGDVGQRYRVRRKIFLGTQNINSKHGTIVNLRRW